MLYVLSWLYRKLLVFFVLFSFLKAEVEVLERAVIIWKADVKQTWPGPNPVNKVLFFSPRLPLKLSNHTGTFWTSSGIHFLLTSLPGLSSDRAQPAQWVGNGAERGLLVAGPGSPAGLPSSSPQVPEGTPWGDTGSQQAGVHHTSGIVVSATSRITGLLEKASIRQMTETSWQLRTCNQHWILTLNSSEIKELMH